MMPLPGTETIAKLVGVLLLELAEEVPDKPALESVRADLLAASRAFQSGTKTDLALRFYLAMRSMFQEVKQHDATPATHQPQQPQEAPHTFNN